MTSLLARLLPLALAILAFPIAAEEVLPQTRPVALDETGTHGEKLGELTFLGGVEIEAGEAKIGGLSGLEWRDGTLFAVSDDGRWFAMTPDEIDGRLVDVIAIETGSLRDLRGKRLKKKQDADAESLTLTSSGEWLVAFEQDHRIWRYPGFENAAAEAKLPVADLALGAKANSGLEALAHAPEGVLACGEWAGEDKPNCMRERARVWSVSRSHRPTSSRAGTPSPPAPTARAMAPATSCSAAIRPTGATPQRSLRSDPITKRRLSPLCFRR